MEKSNFNLYSKANTLLGTQFLSEFGDQITLALLALCLLDITNSTSKVGLVYIITTIGFTVFTILGGYLGDRFSRRNILLYSETGRGLVVLLMVLGIHQSSISLIYISSFFLSLLGSLSRPVTLSVWAQNVPGKSLERYNCLSAFSKHSSEIAGPLIASSLIAFQAASLGFVMDAITFFLCAIIFARIIIDKPNTNTKPAKKNILSGFKIILNDVKIRKYVFFDAVQMIGHGAFNATYLVLAQRDFHWSKSQYSIHLSIVAAFAIFGAFIGSTSFITKMKPVPKLTGATILSTISLSMVLYLEVFPLASLCYGICATLMVITCAVTRTKVQARAHLVYASSLTSVLAARSVLIKAFTLGGMCCCLVMDDFLSLQTTLWIHVIPVFLSMLPALARTEAKKAYPTEAVILQKP